MKTHSPPMLFVILALHLIAKCVAAPVQWPVADGGNGHTYLAVATKEPIQWTDANEMATLLGGHLVTLTSAEENDFVFHLIDNPMYWFSGWNLRGPWTGGYQLPDANEPVGGWRWVTGEPFTFQQWETGQPNNFGANEDRIHFGNKRLMVQTWNDVASDFDQVKSYVVEFPDPNRAPVQWSVREGGNDHSYLAVTAPKGVSWDEANRIAQSVGGYLATITSTREHDLISTLVNNAVYWVDSSQNASAGPWLGGYRHSDPTESGGGWRWVTDEPMNYTNWSREQSDLSESNQNALHLLRYHTGKVEPIIWNHSSRKNKGIYGYVIEFWPGRPLPTFDGIDINFDLDRVKGKMILFCFWNMEQRPSRYCLRQLIRQSQELTEKNIMVVTIHAAKDDKEALAAWMKKNNITVPVGTIQGDLKKILTRWSVESLPWLILTDVNHLVRAEGFAIQELDAKIQQINGD